VRDLVLEHFDHDPPWLRQQQWARDLDRALARDPAAEAHDGVGKRESGRPQRVREVAAVDLEPGVADGAQRQLFELDVELHGWGCHGGPTRRGRYVDCPLCRARSSSRAAAGLGHDGLGVQGLGTETVTGVGDLSDQA